MQTPLDLEAIDASSVTPLTKGVPGHIEPFAMRDLGKQKWNLLREDLPWPVAVLKDSALRHNSAWMKAFTEKAGVRLCPHGKTTMSPQLFQRQLDDGAWGITAATTSQVQVYRRFGVQRILMANQLVGRRNIEYIVDELRSHADFDFYCLVDSVAGVDALTGVLKSRKPTRPLQVLLEIGMPGGRTGARNVSGALEVAKAVAAAPGLLALRGVEFFEGIASINASGNAVQSVESLLAEAAALTEALAAQNLFAPGEVIVTGGGTAYFDLVAACITRLGAKRLLPVLRSGCYLTHDSLLYERHATEIRKRDAIAQSLGDTPRAALEIWGAIQSLPEPGLAILTFGKRDVSYDTHLPVPRFAFRPGSGGKPRSLDERFRIRALNDQHAYLTLPEDHGLAFGDLVGVGISHPCTTFDKWQLLYLVDDDYNVIGGIRTFF